MEQGHLNFTNFCPKNWMTHYAFFSDVVAVLSSYLIWKSKFHQSTHTICRAAQYYSSSSILNHKGHWGTTDDFTTNFLCFSLFSTALWGLLNSRPVHSLMLSSHLFLYLPCLLPPFTVPCKMVLARTDEQETWPYHCSLCLFTMVRRSSCGPTVCWILARTSLLVTWSLYEMCSILW